MEHLTNFCFIKNGYCQLCGKQEPCGVVPDKDSSYTVSFKRLDSGCATLTGGDTQ